MAKRNGRIFISHTAEDRDRIDPLVQRLTEKQANCWTTISPGDTDSELTAQTQKEIAGRDVFLRICTTAALRSGRMRLEAESARAVQQDDVRNGRPNRHIIIDLLMDPNSGPDPAERGYLTIDTTTRPMNDWLVVLYNDAGRMQATRAISRRSTSAVVIISVVVAVLLLFLCVAFFALFQGTFIFMPH
jgi:hypothetical protein